MPTPEELDKIWSRVALEPAAKRLLLENIRLFNCGDPAAARGTLVFGPPGTGKTLILRCIADSVDAKFWPLDIADLKAEYIGQTDLRVRKTWHEARAHGRCVMTIDWCEGVFARRGGANGDSRTGELVTAFLAQWDGSVANDGRVWVIGETYTPEPIDPAMLSRFDSRIETRLPAEPEVRMQILRLEIERIERSFDVPVFVGAATAGMSGRDLSRLVHDICVEAEKQGGLASDAIWREALATRRPPRHSAEPR
jgi:transitional endoplasmic reticulum ATPase